MATSKNCSMCNKAQGQILCAGCDGYFCWKDFKTHREQMCTELDKIIEERNHLQDEINNIAQHNDQENPLFKQIDEWRDATIEKVKQIAAEVRQQVTHLSNSKQMKISIDFKDFSKQLADLKETENFVEHDLTRLNEMVKEFKRDLQQSTQPTTIKLYTKQSNEIDWNELIYVKEQQAEDPCIFFSNNELKCGGRGCAKCGYCRDWYYDNDDWKRRDGATCRFDNAFIAFLRHDHFHFLPYPDFPFIPTFICDCQ